MNQKTTYELTITARLQQLPLPDMEDAIWTRIKTQLDLDMPTDDGDDGGAPDVPSGGGWRWGAGTFVFVAALVATFLLFKKPTTDLQPLPLKTTQTITPSATSEQNKEPVRSLPVRSNSSPPVETTGSPPWVQDSAITAPLTGVVTAPPTVSLPLPDSMRQTTFNLPPPVVLDTISTKKKTRGVTGITDNDYRIVPKQDSM